ncbi:MAG: hypothetical protein H0T53_07640 [Herpetosiphonaceae bacterium]|nr:hypothetical protein [Herpetosiphonaceae bacterium]
MYKVPENIDRTNIAAIVVDIVGILFLLLTLLLWMIVEDMRWYGVYPKDLSGLQLNQYNQWHALKYVELCIAIMLIIYTLYGRKILKLSQRICLLLPIIVLWLYWLVVH